MIDHLLLFSWKLFLNQWCILKLTIVWDQRHAICFIFIFTSLWSFSLFFFPGKPHSFVLFVCYLSSITITLLNQFSSSVHMLCNLGNVSPNCPLSQSSIFHKVDLYLVASNMGFGFVIVLFSFCAFLGFPFHYVLHFLTTFIINLFSLMP